jgi:hypothetical protein
MLETSEGFISVDRLPVPKSEIKQALIAVARVAKSRGDSIEELNKGYMFLAYFVSRTIGRVSGIGNVNLPRLGLEILGRGKIIVGRFLRREKRGCRCQRKVQWLACAQYLREHSAMGDLVDG